MLLRRIDVRPGGKAREGWGEGAEMQIRGALRDWQLN